MFLVYCPTSASCLAATSARRCFRKRPTASRTCSCRASFSWKAGMSCRGHKKIVAAQVMSWWCQKAAPWVRASNRPGGSLASTHAGCTMLACAGKHRQDSAHPPSPQSATKAVGESDS